MKVDRDIIQLVVSVLAIAGVMVFFAMAITSGSTRNDEIRSTCTKTNLVTIPRSVPHAVYDCSANPSVIP